MTSLELLKNQEFIQRCYYWITAETLITSSSSNVLKPYAVEENLWWNKLISQENNNQRTTMLCESAAYELLTKLWYKNIRKPKQIKGDYSNKKYAPDRECDEFIREVKGRNWTTPWTAWEKILWTPLKYSEVPRLYAKPLKILVIWYQEREAKNWFSCWNLVDPSERGTEELNKILILLKKLWIEYVWFTDLLKKVN